MLWTDKYRPQSLDEVVGNNKEKKTILEWINNWKRGDPQNPFISLRFCCRRADIFFR